MIYQDLVKFIKFLYVENTNRDGRYSFYPFDEILMFLDMVEKYRAPKSMRNNFEISLSKKVYQFDQCLEIYRYAKEKGDRELEELALFYSALNYDSDVKLKTRMKNSEKEAIKKKKNSIQDKKSCVIS